ncbi:MAG: hypothetical protein K9M82_06570 [Deltaproteobacteria bacterium]|nr:hypothetical protein [Deltaproteobacteria bacterium]
MDRNGRNNQVAVRKTGNRLCEEVDTVAPQHADRQLLQCGSAALVPFNDPYRAVGLRGEDARGPLAEAPAADDDDETAPAGLEGEIPGIGADGSRRGAGGG